MKKFIRCLVENEKKMHFKFFFHSILYEEFFFLMYFLHPLWKPPPPSTAKFLPTRSSTPTTTTRQTTVLSTTTTTTLFTSSSMISSTMKSNRNRIFLPISISLISIILCISFSYCICLYFKHYFIAKATAQSNMITITRPSIAASIYSTNPSWYTYDLEDHRTIGHGGTERRLSTDSVELFRY